MRTQQSEDWGNRLSHAFETCPIKELKVEKELKEEATPEPRCPTCGEGVELRCRCHVGYWKCKNGHEWVDCKTHGLTAAFQPEDGSHALCSKCAEEIERGSAMSGHYGHAGRPGKVGGSDLGGVAIGRADAPDSDEHFKFSGHAALSRVRGAAEVSIKPNRGKGRFEVHGSTDARGRIKPGKSVLRTNGNTVEIDHDELHALRSKMRYALMTNEKDIKESAGKPIVRGKSLEVKVGDKTVRIPIDKHSVKAIDGAAEMARAHGLSFTAERRGQIRSAVKEMDRTNPIRVVKDLKFSKAGQLAAFQTHVERHSKPELERIVNRRGRSAEERRALERTMGKLLEHRGTGRKARETLSGTQAMKSYKRGAALMTEMLKAR